VIRDVPEINVMFLKHAFNNILTTHSKGVLREFATPHWL